MALTVRTWLRYVVPLTLLSAIALAPIAWLALRSPAAADVRAARAQVRLGWMLAGSAWACQLVLVAGVAPTVRALARREPLSQWRAFAAGLGSLARGLVPCAIALAAIVLGGMALVVPGMMLIVLLALTGASDQLGAPPRAPLADGIAVVRANLVRVAIVVAAIVAIDVAIALCAQTALIPRLASKVATAKLVPIRTFVRVVALALVALSPLAACALAALYERGRFGPSDRTS